MLAVRMRGVFMEVVVGGWTRSGCELELRGKSLHAQPRKTQACTLHYPEDNEELREFQEAF
jgi:hypothetical protein